MNKDKIEQLKQKLLLEKENLTTELESFAKKDKQIKDNWTAQVPMKDKGNTARREQKRRKEKDKENSKKYKIEKIAGNGLTDDLVSTITNDRKPSMDA